MSTHGSANADPTAASTTFVASDGDGYELQMGRWSQRLATLLIDFAEIIAAARVLDVGCGTGNLSRALADPLQARPYGCRS